MKKFFKALCYFGLIMFGAVISHLAIQAEEKKTGKAYFLDSDNPAESTDQESPVGDEESNEG